MKIYTVILSKPGRTVTCLISYRDASWPDEVTWAGDRTDFRLQDGSPVSLLASEGRLKEMVSYQARQAGAAVQMRDDGGEIRLGTAELNAAAGKASFKSSPLNARILRLLRHPVKKLGVGSSIWNS